MAAYNKTQMVLSHDISIIISNGQQPPVTSAWLWHLLFWSLLTYIFRAHLCTVWLPLKQRSVTSTLNQQWLPLACDVISHLQFCCYLKMMPYILGENIATLSRFNGICNNDYSTDLLSSLMVKELRNRSASVKWLAPFTLFPGHLLTT